MKDVPNRKYLQIDDEGYFVSQGTRLGDRDFGVEALENLKQQENGSFSTLSGGVPVIVEPFDEPLVATHVEYAHGRWAIDLPYGVHSEFDLSTLTLDEWDRFHGRTVGDLPFVFSRNAQMDFFNLVDDYDDDSVLFRGARVRIPGWLRESQTPQTPTFWSDLYRAPALPPWDMNEPHPAFADMIKQMKLPKSRVIVLGAGRGHDAAFFARQGHLVTAVDFSADAIDQARALYGDLPNLKFLVGDVFHLPHELDGQFDVVAEHTCYCAVSPDRRAQLTSTWKRLLDEGGYLLGVFFAMSRFQGPPFGGSEWEIRERLRKTFQFLYWTRWHFSTERRIGTEIVIVGQKK